MNENDKFRKGGAFRQGFNLGFSNWKNVSCTEFYCQYGLDIEFVIKVNEWEW